ncbi:MAG: cell division ATP-binding protein FtsE [Armatimonadetes bacterium]|nr:cell division ATP-binding protein FtsE [Armatimonadota bacterium]
MLVVRNVTVRYPNGVEALSRLNLHLKRGEFVFLVGSTGSGKSTLLKLFYREVQQTEGSVIVDEQDVSGLPRRAIPLLRRKVGVVFQDFRLLPYKTARENVAFALRVIGAEPRSLHMRVARALSRVGLDHRADALPEQLSGGEQQRVSIARALVNEPAVLLADEPTGNLDPDVSLEVMEVIESVAESGTTVVVATHDRDIVNHFRKRVVELVAGRLARDQVAGGYRATDTLPLAIPGFDELTPVRPAGVPFADT